MRLIDTLRLILVIAEIPGSFSKEKDSPRVAIVGAGIGGASTAFFISRDFPGANITVFEKGRVGGRLATLEVNGREYETGGSIIHPANKLMVDYLDICQLQKKKGPSEFGTGSGFAVHQEIGEIKFQESTYSWINKLKLIWRYGLRSLLKLDFYTKNLLQCFESIYPKLNSGVAYRTVGDLLESMSPTSKHGESSAEMLELTKVSLWDKLVSGGVGVEPLLVQELVTAGVRTNYGQWPDGLHAFVGGVSLAGNEGGLWAVDGGNYKVAECAIHQAGAHLIKATVKEIERKGETFEVSFENESGELEKNEFDIVVVATPQTEDMPRIKGDLMSSLEFPGFYQTTIATVVEGEPDPTALGFSDKTECPSTHFFLSRNLPIASIAKLSPVDYKGPEDEKLSPLYKIFSSRELEKEEISKLFSPVHKITTVDWLAYPHYNVSEDLDLSSFILSPGLFYTNRIEWSASAMEMSAIAAKNVANLVKEYWSEAYDSKPEKSFYTSNSRNEL